MLDLKTLEKELGPGPMRFAGTGEKSIMEQIEALNSEEKKCFDDLKEKWNKKYPDQPFSDEMILRFARCSPGNDKFNSHASWKVMKKYDRRYLDLKAEKMEQQLLSKVRDMNDIVSFPPRRPPLTHSILFRVLFFIDSVSSSRPEN